MRNFSEPGKASFILGGQWGSEAKGSCAAWLATRTDSEFDIATTNAGAQAGHTSTHEGKTKVVFHLPTYSLYRPCFTFLNAGSIIDVEVLLRELDENPQVLKHGFGIHPNAAVITDDCKAAEGRDDSAQTKIASTRKGVGEALARKVLRSGLIARDHPVLSKWVSGMWLNQCMHDGDAVLVEVPQGIGLSLNHRFYPYVTSRNCTVMQAMSDAGIHPKQYHKSMLVLRSFPIRVGNIDRPVHVNPGHEPDSDQLGFSGPYYNDQREISWAELGVAPEITTVTKRVRRVFTFSRLQAYEAFDLTKPDVVFLSFMDYFRNSAKEAEHIDWVRRTTGAAIVTGWGPTTDDARIEL